MITEKRFYAVPPILLTSNGTQQGQFKIADASIFKVGQIVTLQSSTQQPILVKIKRISDQNTIFVGDEKKDISHRLDISAFLVTDGAFVFSNEQPRPSVPEEQVERVTYEEEPVVARRVVLVDKFGEKIDESNPLNVTANVDVGGVVLPLIQNLSVINSGQEYPISVPITTKRFMIKSRSGNTRIQISYTAGQTNTNFITLSAGSAYTEENLTLIAPLMLYIECNKPNQIIELISWS